VLRKNVAGQVVTFVLVSATTGAVVTGATVTAKATLDGTQSAGAGTVTELGSGQYKYAPTQGETNGATLGLLLTAVGAVPVNLHCFITAANPSDAVRFGLSALPNAAADAAGGLPISDAGGLDLDGLNGRVVTVQADLASLDGDVAAVQTDVDTVATGVALALTNIAAVDTKVTAAQADLATLDTEVLAVKAKTDSLTFTQAGHVDANVQRINDVALIGDGDATPWGPV
jgi:hypothetical protein